MTNRVIILVWTMAMLVAGFPPPDAARAEQLFLGIVTGEMKSTAHQMGMDLKALFMRHNIHLAVFDSGGSVENIYAVYQRPGNHLGLVQSDVLSFVAKVKSDRQLRLIADKIKWVYALYDQEVHVLAGSHIHSFDELAGRRVAVGTLQSGAYLTSRLLFEISGVTPAELLDMGSDRALEELKAGRIDAAVIVDGIPAERLALDVSVQDGLHLLPIVHEGIWAFYPEATIPSGTYPWQTTEVSTVTVKAVLVAYDFRNHHCRTIGTAAGLIRDNLEWLQFNGHPKWKSIDLNSEVKGWERYKCLNHTGSAAAMARSETVRNPEPNPVASAIEAVFKP